MTLLVNFADGDWIIGFEGFPFHTHGNILSAWGYGGTPKEATRSFISDILASPRPIVKWRVNGRIRNFGVPTEFNRAELETDIAKCGLPGETFEACFWDGRAAAK